MVDKGCPITCQTDTEGE